MSRKFKFRAWTDDHMETSDSLLWLSNFFEYVENNEWPVMQLTGLQDKNKVDIYEGDILVIGSFDKDIMEQYRSRPAKVVWDDIEAAFYLRSNSLNVRLSHQYQPEIVGNIYENPELLIPNR